MSSIAMEVCPMCATCPQLAGRWRLRVQCRCGACGPRMKSQHEAIGRWNSVVSCMRELMRSGMNRSEPIRAERRASIRQQGAAGVRRLARRLARQCGLAPELGL